MRIMASDRRQFEMARDRWNILHDDMAYSVPVHLGKTAIVVSNDQTVATDDRELRSFLSEALFLEKTEREHGRKAEVIEDAKGVDFVAVLQDPSFANIVTIGHGALSYLYIDNGLRVRKNGMLPNEIPNNRFDWRDVSRYADHLKTGYFIQRHCGNASRRLSVPLGSFAMTSHGNVLAAANKYFSPRQMPSSIFDPDHLIFPPTGCRLEYREVLSAYSYTDFIEQAIIQADAQATE